MVHRNPAPSGGRHTPLVVGLVTTALLVLSLAAVGVATRIQGHDPAVRGGMPPTPGPEVQAAGPPARAAPAADPAACSPVEAARAIAAMPLRDRLAQLLIVGVNAAGTAEALSLVRSEHVGAIFLVGDATTLLTGNRLARVQAASPIPLMIAVDDEGGRVQRIAALDGSMPSARQMAATMTPREVYRLALRRGHALARRGVTMNFAPVLDVSYQPSNAVIGDRSFSPNPRVVTRYGSAFAQGMRDAGILPVFKHFPGQGRADGDSHAGPATTPPLVELARVDLLPYRALLGRGERVAVMVGHLRVPGLTPAGVPASLSAATVNLLRTEFDFHGLIITDDLYAMDAIRDRYTVAQATRKALAAGFDMALMVGSAKLHAVLDHLEAAVAEGTLAEQRVNEAVRHVLRAKGVEPCAVALG